MSVWKLLIAVVLLVLVVVFGFREYQVRRIYQLSGQISSCSYSDAARFCSLFTADDGRLFLLTEGSVSDLKKIDSDIAKFYNKPIKIKGHILGQKIGIEGLGKIPRIDVVKFEI